MMNVIAITLVVASMAFAGVWSPNPQGEGQVITKGGHRAVVVEYADENTADGHVNTKVVISPLTGAHHKPGLLSTAEDQLSSAAASVAGVAQDAKKAAAEDWRGPGEVICDAFGKCKDKISGAIYKAKDKVTETAQEVEEGAKETVGSVKEKAKEAASKATHTAEEAAGKAKQSASRAKEAVKDTAEDLKKKGKAAVDSAGDTLEETAEKAKKKGKETTKEISDIAKRAKEVLWDAVSYLIPGNFFNSLMSLVHLLGFATAYGTATWVTFAMSHLLAKSLPRQQFGVLQSRVYPVYFKAMASCIGIALLGHLLGRRRHEASSVAGRLQAYNLAGLVSLVLVNLLYLEPRATKVMYERMKLEKEEGRGVSGQATRFVDQTGLGDTPLTATTTTTTTTTTTAAQRREDGGEVKSKMERLNRKLRKLNSYSSLLNVMTLMGLTWHLVYLSQRLCL